MSLAPTTTNPLKPIEELKKPAIPGVLPGQGQYSQASNLQPIPGSNPVQTGPLTAAQTKPQVSDFVREAERLGLRSFDSVRQVLNRDIEEQGQALNRQLFGRSVTPESNLGQKAVTDALVKRSRELEPIAQQVATNIGLQALDDQRQQTERILNLIVSGNLRPDENLKANLEARGISGELISTSDAERLAKKGRKNDGTLFTSDAEADEYWAQRGFSTELLNQFGTDDKGQPFQSLRQAESFWTNRNYQADVVREFGIDATTGKPFNSRQEAVAAATLKFNLDETQQRLTLDFGLKADGTPFTSAFEAEVYKKQQQINSFYGTPGGKEFKSDQEAIEYWGDRNFNKTIIQKYGTSEAGIPFPSEVAALDYLEAKGADRDITKRYGLADDGKPFKSLQEAINITELRDLKKNLADLPPEIKVSIGSIDEFNHYMDTGRTYEDEIADILSTQKDLVGWQAAMPSLEKALLQKTQEEQKWADKVSREWFKESRGTLDRVRAEKAALQQVVADIKAGVNPTVDQQFISDIKNQA